MTWARLVLNDCQGISMQEMIAIFVHMLMHESSIGVYKNTAKQSFTKWIAFKPKLFRSVIIWFSRCSHNFQSFSCCFLMDTLHWIFLLYLSKQDTVESTSWHQKFISHKKRFIKCPKIMKTSQNFCIIVVGSTSFVIVGSLACRYFQCHNHIHHKLRIQKFFFTKPTRLENALHIVFSIVINKAKLLLNSTSLLKEYIASQQKEHQQCNQESAPF